MGLGFVVEQYRPASNLTDKGTEKDKKEAVAYEQGCVLNFLQFAGADGYIPIVVFSTFNPANKEHSWSFVVLLL